MKAVTEHVESGARINLSLRRGRCTPRDMCVRLLTICKEDRPVPEIACEECDKTARQFRKDALADGWFSLYYSRPWPNQRRFLINGWGFLGRCASCGPKVQCAKPGCTATGGIDSSGLCFYCRT